MHPITNKVGLYVTLCGAALAFACTCAWAQDNPPNLSPVDRSVHAGVDEIDDLTQEPPPSPDVSKHPQMLSRWSPQVGKQLPGTTVWSTKAKAANAAEVSGDGNNSVAQHKKVPKDLAVWGSQNDSGVPALETGARLGDFNGHLYFDVRLLAHTDDEPSPRPPIFPVLSGRTSSHTAGISSPFNRNPFGQESSLAFSTKSIFPDQAVRKKLEAQPRPPVPSPQLPISPDSQANQKP
jgi:hypothetical protein